MLTVFIWIIISLLLIISFLGVVIPIIPSPLLLWIVFLLYYFAIAPLPWWFLACMAILTFFLVMSDIWANKHFVKKWGGSRQGEWAAAIGVIIGVFIIPPYGIIVVPFVIVLIVELLMKKTFTEALNAAIGSLIGFLSGVLAKFIIQFIMVVWFLVEVIFLI